jgi:hypothetical protein
MKTITRHAIVVEHDGRDYEVPALPPLADWFDPLVTASDTELRVTYLAVDDACRDNPWDDTHGIEYKLFDRGYERDEWIAIQNEDPDPDIVKAQADGRFFWLERYEHGLVRYAPIGESSQVDRQWDVAVGVGWLMLDADWNETVDNTYLDMARAMCEELTSWCNGDVYGVVHVTLDLQTGDEIDVESCWGYIGLDYAEATAREEHS